MRDDPMLVVKSEESAEARRERNAKPHNRAARREYNRSKPGLVAHRKAQEEYKTEHPERVTAQNKARHAKGSANGHKCASCGKAATHFHHTSYDGDGTSGRWLCHEHHVKGHLPKSNLTAKTKKSDHESDHDFYYEDQIPGGHADAQDPSDFDHEQLEIGTAHELEHTDDSSIAAEIAMDHLIEDPEYYEKLARIGKSNGAHPDPHAAAPKEHREAGAKTRADYAAPSAYRCPIPDEKHTRAAVSFFSVPRNFGKYGPSERAARVCFSS